MCIYTCVCVCVCVCVCEGERERGYVKYLGNELCVTIITLLVKKKRTSSEKFHKRTQFHYIRYITYLNPKYYGKCAGYKYICVCMSVYTCICFCACVWYHRTL